MYKLVFAQRALDDIEKIRKSGDLQLQKKLRKIVDELKEHPRTGSGNPEALKGGNNITYSRRLDKKNRIVYDIEDLIVTVTVLSALGHYDDK